MKKYLMLALAAVVFASCSKSEDVSDSSRSLVTDSYKAAFLKYVGGSIAPDQTWGFSSNAYSAGAPAMVFTRANAGKDYPSTSTGINANANEWADATKEFGGWVVPDALTEGQKLRVKAYFQANPNLTYTDPGWRHFFVQQVYKGASDPGANSTEKVIAANNSVYDSGNMNLLTVGQNNQHINNFNAGDCTSRNDVLDNGQKVGGSSHTDKIMLMVNIDDTSCFGYHETGGSKHHNDKAALVSASEIDAWAASNGNIGEAVVDKWGRSFVGLDLELRNANDVKSTTKVTYNNGPEGVSYIVLNNEFVTVDGSSTMKYNNEDVYFIDTNTNQYSAETSTLNDSQLMTEVRINDQYMGKALNMDNINAKLADGWLPVMNKNLREWVKVTGGDGYFTDWIVTLSEAQRIGENPDPTPTPTPLPTADLRIIAEDLTASEASDFDFNDIVVDVVYGSPAKLILQAAGGTLPLRINSDNNLEVHKLFGVNVSDMVNTNAGPSKDPVLIDSSLGFNIDINSAEQAGNIKLEVQKDGKWIEMTAVKGEPASKLAVDTSYGWLDERKSIKGEYPKFVDWATKSNFKSKWW